MKRTIKIIFFGCLFAIYGCAGGSKILKEPESFEPKQPIGLWSDSVIAVALDWIVVRDGPGTWATNANWDQYIFRIENLSGSTVSITNVHLVDLMGRKVTMLADRKELLAASKSTVNQYKDIELKVQEGAGSATMTAAVVGGTVVGGTAALMGSIGTMLGVGGGAALTTGGLIVVAAAPVILLSQMSARGAVDRKIKALHSKLPQGITQGKSQRFDLFFPISPSPQKVVVEYVDAAGLNTSIELDTSVGLNGLHLPEGTDSYWSQIGATKPKKQ